MKSSYLSAVVLSVVLSVGSAVAADLPSRKAPPYFPPPPPPPMWTGFYVGLNAGGTWSESNSIHTSAYNFQATPNLLFGPASAGLANTWLAAGGNGGFIGGGQIGYNWQFNNNFVVGVEADIQGVTSSSSTAASSAILPGVGNNWTIGQVATASRNLDYIGTVRGRLGWLITPALLVYGTGGLAYGGVTANAGVTQVVFQQPPAYFSTGAFSDTRAGWTAGGGGEWMFSPNWSAKVEYLYYDLGSVTFNQSPLVNVGAIPGVIWYSNAVQSSTRFNGHIVRAGLNYHFNWGAPAPVVAKYESATRRSK
jgi:outer membrane immunogenic protein